MSAPQDDSTVGRYAIGQRELQSIDLSPTKSKLESLELNLNNLLSQTSRCSPEYIGFTFGSLSRMMEALSNRLRTIKLVGGNLL